MRNIIMAKRLVRAASVVTSGTAASGSAETALADLLADLRLWCAATCLDFETLNTRALMHFEAERKELTKFLRDCGIPDCKPGVASRPESPEP